MNKPKADKDQAQRFVAAAQAAGCDETGEAFEQAFGRIVPPKLPARTVGEVKQPKGRKPRTR